ncbi:hypothetical protein AN958_07974 [Leucoagaricus sp. SymC.cos]|nr:hypothetical protein AN958_07974 [Leucoagaricus sp. SymC.cos]
MAKISGEARSNSHTNCGMRTGARSAMRTTATSLDVSTEALGLHRRTSGTYHSCCSLIPPMLPTATFTT